MNKFISIILIIIVLGISNGNKVNDICGRECPFCLDGKCKEYIGHFGQHRCFHCNYQWND